MVFRAEVGSRYMYSTYRVVIATLRRHRAESILILRFLTTRAEWSVITINGPVGEYRQVESTVGKCLHSGAGQNCILGK